MKARYGDLLAEIAGLARDVPAPIVGAVCDELERLPADASMSASRRAAKRVVPTVARAAFERLLSRSSESGGNLSPSNLAWALRSAAATAAAQRAEQMLQLVWTGPAGASTVLRRTDQALYQLIEEARKEITLVTFAAYHVPELAAALCRAADRGVEITFVLEDPQTAVGQAAFEAIRSVGDELAERSAIYIWPLERRPRDAAGRYGSLHVKCAVADTRAALVSSANLTAYALGLNMELGVLIRGGSAPGEIARHLRELIEGGHLVRVQS